MRTMRILTAAAIAGALLLAGCGRERVAVELTVSARGADGAPVAAAEVVVAGRPAGATDAEGRLVVRERRQPGEEVRVVVTAAGSRPWEGSFVVRRRDRGETDRVALVAQLGVPG
ncbi:MAG TPA: hypothetical protein VNM66_09640, partial [Thermodesulfobacteriota bacterium]|nr:hypothetical protein [Thermodesulfobacteriota bacterium]